MSSKIKVDTIENVAGSGNVSLGSGHNLVVPGNITGQGTAAITSNATVGGTLGVTGNLTTGNITTGNTSIVTGGRFISSQTSNDPWLKGVNSSNTETSYIKKDGQIYSAFGISLGGTGAANTLDDYEEGTFTPVLYFGGGTTGITYSSGRQLGQYTKIGDSVFIYIHIQLTSKGSAAGAVQIHNLPFTVKSGGHHYIPAKTWIAAMASLNETPTFRFMTANTVMDCYQMSSNTYSTVTNSNCTNTTAFQISGHYVV